MLKVKIRNHKGQNGYTVASDGCLRRRDRTILRPIRTRKYRGEVATAMFNNNKRTESILTTAGFTPVTV